MTILRLLLVAVGQEDEKGTDGVEGLLKTGSSMDLVVQMALDMTSSEPESTAKQGDSLRPHGLLLPATLI